MHYDNPHGFAGKCYDNQPIHFKRTYFKKTSDRIDSSGIRFYLGNSVPKYELGYLSLGVDSNPGGIVIPPHAGRFVIDGYCPAIATAVFITEKTVEIL